VPMNIYQQLPKPFFVLAPMDDVTDTVFRQMIADLPYPSHLDGVQGGQEKRGKRTGGTSSEDSTQLTRQSAKNISRVSGSAKKQADVVRGYGAPDLFFTEFVNVDGLQSPGRPKLLPKLQFTDKETPLVAQLWGLKPDNFYKTVRQIADGTMLQELNGSTRTSGGFAGVDLNMGCPVKTVVKNGACSALIDNRSLAKEIILAVKEAAGDSLSVSVKTRLGRKQTDFSWHEFLLELNLDMLTVHGRTAKQMSKVPAD
jgi:tRNA-dihydrouridine synthase